MGDPRRYNDPALAVFDHDRDESWRSLRRAVYDRSSTDAVHLGHRSKLTGHNHVFGVVIQQQMLLRGQPFSPVRRLWRGIRSEVKGRLVEDLRFVVDSHLRPSGGISVDNVVRLSFPLGVGKVIEVERTQIDKISSSKLPKLRLRQRQQTDIKVVHLKDVDSTRLPNERRNPLQLDAREPRPKVLVTRLNDSVPCGRQEMATIDPKQNACRDVHRPPMLVVDAEGDYGAGEYFAGRLPAVGEDGSW
jgi:hypothetical protein